MNTIKTKLVPLVLLQGPEVVLQNKAIKNIVNDFFEVFPLGENIVIDAEQEEVSSLVSAASPSLFSTQKIVIVQNISKANKEFIEQSSTIIKQIANEQNNSSQPQIVIVFVHQGGVQNKGILTLLKDLNAKIIQCQEIKWDNQKIDFAQNEFRENKREIDSEALISIVTHNSNNLLNLQSLISQICVDISEKRISKQSIEQYLSNREDVNIYKLIDFAVQGNLKQTVEYFDDILLVQGQALWILSALAIKLRTLAKIYTCKKEGADPIKSLKITPYQLKQNNLLLNGLNSRLIANAITMVANTDFNIKTGKSVIDKIAIKTLLIDIAKLKNSTNQ